MNTTTDLFGEMIYSYTRAQAIEDGELVDVSDMAKQSGFKISVAVTRAVPTVQKFTMYAKEAGPYVLATLETIQQHHANIDKLDARLAALDVKDDALLVKYGSDLGKKLAAAPAPQSGPQNAQRQTTTVKM